MDWYDMFVIAYLIIFVADQIVDLRGKKKQMDALESREKRQTKQERERERERESDAIKIVYVNAENNFFCRVFY